MHRRQTTVQESGAGSWSLAQTGDWTRYLHLGFLWKSRSTNSLGLRQRRQIVPSHRNVGSLGPTSRAPFFLSIAPFRSQDEGCAGPQCHRQSGQWLTVKQAHDEPLSTVGFAHGIQKSNSGTQESDRRSDGHQGRPTQRRTGSRTETALASHSLCALECYHCSHRGTCSTRRLKRELRPWNRRRSTELSKDLEIFTRGGDASGS